MPQLLPSCERPRTYFCFRSAQESPGHGRYSSKAAPSRVTKLWYETSHCFYWLFGITMASPQDLIGTNHLQGGGRSETTFQTPWSLINLSSQKIFDPNPAAEPQKPPTQSSPVSYQTSRRYASLIAMPIPESVSTQISDVSSECLSTLGEIPCGKELQGQRLSDFLTDLKHQQAEAADQASYPEAINWLTRTVGFGNELYTSTEAVHKRCSYLHTNNMSPRSPSEGHQQSSAGRGGAITFSGVLGPCQPEFPATSLRPKPRS
ncbi:hypothetical protein EJ06DRAFT_376773 [Trichodelitschia bisporula]|uniref:Uncharacterized protein n=1 Tax=Trichodelitschia bisporula TaxID=703511 RepID=A0A6G1HYU0_9PEZI|nr:hypothetical protein EJ06DRAFT_376773 [Trichodelitschia bisporula]